MAHPKVHHSVQNIMRSFKAKLQLIKYNKIPTIFFAFSKFYNTDQNNLDIKGSDTYYVITKGEGFSEWLR